MNLIPNAGAAAGAAAGTAAQRVRQSHYINPTNLSITNMTRTVGNGVGSINRVANATEAIGGHIAGNALGRADYASFMGNAGRSLSMGGRKSAYGAAKMLGNFSRATSFLSNNFELMGKKMTYGRAGVTAGLGLLAARNGANMIDRMRYGDYSGAMMSGAMTAAAGYGAYSAYMYKGALRNHFNNAAKAILKNFR